jgi:anti-sigma factor RsiW
MTCDAVQSLLHPYIDGELAPAQATAVAEHLASCDACSSDYQSLLTTVQTLREGLVQYQAPDVLRARIRGALRDAPHDSTVVASRLSWS